VDGRSIHLLESDVERVAFERPREPQRKPQRVGHGIAAVEAGAVSIDGDHVGIILMADPRSNALIAQGGSVEGAHDPFCGEIDAEPLGSAHDHPREDVLHLAEDEVGPRPR
jgi:hypothetical protein